MTLRPGAFLALLLLLVGAAARGEEGLLSAFQAASDEATREALVSRDKDAFAAEVVEALIRLEPSTSSPLLEEAARTYLRVTGDSLLVADLVFAVTALAERRQAWIQGIDHVARGEALQAEKQYPEAVAVYAEAVASFHAAGHARREAVAWGTLGTAWFQAGERDSAQACYKTALVLRRRLGDPFLVARALNTLGQFANQKAEYDSALAYFDEARRLREELGVPEELARTLVTLGDVHVKLGNLEAARSSYRRALDVLGPGSVSAAVTGARIGLGNVLNALGEHREAADMYRDLLGPAEARGDDRTVAVLRKNLADELLSLGDPVGALNQLRLTRDLEEREGNLYEVASTLNRTGEALSVVGDLEAALGTWQTAVETADSSENAVVSEEARLNLAQGLGKTGLYERALQIHEDLLAESTGDSLFRAQRLRDMAVLEGDRGNHERSLELHREALALHQAGQDVMRAIEDRTNVGMQLTALRRLPEGRVELDRAMAVAESLDYREFLDAIYLNIADNADQAGDLATAREYNAKTIEIMESFRAASRGTNAMAYEAQIHVLARLAERTGDVGYRDEAFTVAEQGKAQALLGVLSEARVGLTPQLPMDMETRKAFLERHVNGARHRLRLAEETAAPADSVRALRSRLDELERAHADILQWGRLQDPRFAAIDPGEPATLQDVQEHLLSTDTALLEFALGDTVSYAWVATPDSITLHKLPGRERIASLVQDLRGALDRDAGALRGRKVVNAQPIVPGLADACAALGDAILAPVMPSLWRARRLLVIPDGPLQFVPFDILLTDVREVGAEPGAWPYALRNAVVSYGPSATSLLYLAEWRAERKTAAGGFLGVGDPVFTGGGEAPLLAAVPGETALRAGLTPLPFSRTEVERIGNLFEERDRVLLVGTLAKEKTLTEPGFLSRFRYVHFATHGFADERRPERSRIALSYPEDASEDGYLQASEVYGLQLQADLVVLSACESGRGKMIQGEGVMGLPRAFLYAGTPAVVVSLWNVSDEATADLMTAFYEGMIRDGLPPADALALAKEALRTGGRWAHPFYWAAFVLVGAG